MLEFFSIEIGQTGSFRTFLESGHVAFWSEKPDFAFFVFVGFKAFVASDPVMQGRVKGVEIEWSEGLQKRGLPFLIIVDDVDHMITGKCAKSKGFGIKDGCLPLGYDFFDEIFELEIREQVHRKCWRRRDRHFWGTG